MFKRNNTTRTLGVVLSLALALTSVGFAPDSFAKAKSKAKLKTKKVSVVVGKKKTIKLKKKAKKAKYTFKTSNKKVAKVTKKGVVKGVKAGKAKITVKEQLKGSKKKVKVGVVKVTVKKKTTSNPTKPSTATTAPKASAAASAKASASASAASSAVTSAAPSADTASAKPDESKAPVKSDAPSAAPSADAPVKSDAPSAAPSADAPVKSDAPSTAPTKAPATAAPTKAPATAAPTKKPGPVKIDKADLSAFSVEEGAEGVSYDAATGVLSAEDIALFRLNLPGEVAEGEEVVVHVKGTYNKTSTEGFRAYLINGEEGDFAKSDICAFQDLDGWNDGVNFDVTFTLTAEDVATQIQFKGQSHGTPIEDLKLTVVEFGGNSDLLPSAAPVVTPQAGNLPADLNEASAGEYDEATGTLTVEEESLFTLPLPEDVNAGDEVKVHVVGTYTPGDEATPGFRAYLIPGSDSAQSNIWLSWEDEGWNDGNFDCTFTLTVNEDCFASLIQFKAYQHGAIIENLKLRLVEFVGAGSAETAAPSVAPSAAPATAAPVETATEETATEETATEETATEETGKIDAKDYSADLSKDFELSDKVVYDAENNKLVVTDKDAFALKLAETVDEGDAVLVGVKGKIGDGSDFRMYLSPNDSDNAQSNIFKFSEGETDYAYVKKENDGTFTAVVKLEMGANPNLNKDVALNSGKILFKGAQWGVNIGSLEIEQVDYTVYHDVLK